MLFKSQNPGFDFCHIRNRQQAESKAFLESELLPQLRSAMDECQVPPKGRNELEHKVFVDLLNFFSRYYHKGQLSSTQLFKSGAQAIPLEGQDVKLYWANAEQYFVQSSECGYGVTRPRDHFIHKDLKSFLGRELENYIKEELLQLADPAPGEQALAAQYLSKIKLVKLAGAKIIAFLAGVEELCKQAWLQKRLVLETNYCITLDLVPDYLFPEILKNQAQLEAWQQLFAIDGLTGAKEDPLSQPLTEKFLRENPYLVAELESAI